MAAGVTATVHHDIGDSFLDGLDFIVPTRKGTRLSCLRLHIRSLTRDEVIPTNGLPALIVERTIADLVEIGTDLSLVAGCVRDAIRADKLATRDRLVSHLSPSPRAAGATARLWPTARSSWPASLPKDGTVPHHHG